MNLRFDFRAPAPALADLGRTHLIAIGGAGMSAVARLLLARGVPVQGSDGKDSPGLQSLRDLGAQVWVGHDAVHLDGAETVVISSAIREDNVELRRARELGLPVLHRAQALASVMAGAPSIAVAGANGKTTTTSMLTVALAEAGVQPSFAAGGELADLGTNAQWHKGSPFVVEADESDGSFLVYRPEVALITNVQPDHLDFYGDYAHVQAAYREFVLSTPEDGVIVVCADDAGSADLGRAVADRRRVLSYGRAAHSDLRVESSVAEGLGSRSILVSASGERHELVLRTPGEHNVLNACAAFLGGVEGLGIEPGALLRGLARFSGARRRFDVCGEVAGVTVIDDYAHNVGKVEAVVRTAAEIAHRRGGELRVVFQPHLYSRTRDFAAGFAAALAPADEVLLLDIYGAREDPVEGVSSHLITDRLPDSAAVVTRTEAVAGLAARARSGDVVMTVGAGDITDLAPLIVEALGAR